MSIGAHPVKREYSHSRRQSRSKRTARHDFTTYATVVHLYLIDLLLEGLYLTVKNIFFTPFRSFQKTLNSNPCTSSQRIGLNGGGDMSTLSYHFPEFAIRAVRTCARRCHPLRTPVSPVGRTRNGPPNYSTHS